MHSTTKCGRSLGWFLETTCFVSCVSFDICWDLINPSDLQQPNQQFPPPRQRFCRSLAFGQHACGVHARAVSYLPQGESVQPFPRGWSHRSLVHGRGWRSAMNWRKVERFDGCHLGVEKVSRWPEFLGDNFFYLGGGELPPQGFVSTSLTWRGPRELRVVEDSFVRFANGFS